MQKFNEQILCKALDLFKEMIIGGECTKQDISHYIDESKYIMDRYGVGLDRKHWLTKDEACKELGISSSTFDRKVLNGLICRGKKMAGQNKLVWKGEQIEQLKRMMLLRST